MKRTFSILMVLIVLASCGNSEKSPEGKQGNVEAQLDKLKKQRAKLDEKILALENEVRKNSPRKKTPVSIRTIEMGSFKGYIDVQAQVSGDEDVLATPQAPGVVTQVYVKPGQKVSKGQILAMLDAAAISQQIKAADAQYTLAKQLYEKQEKLWKQNIGTEVQLLQAKAQYESATSQRAALVAQKDMYTIKSPISGIVDEVSLKEGDMASPGMAGIRVVGSDKLKVTASLGENYIGKVKEGDPVILVFNENTDSIQSKLTYVAKSVNPVSRAFNVEVKINPDARVRPNMSCKMVIVNYENPNTISVPVPVVQKTADGNIIYIAEGNVAKAVPVRLGRISSGQVEILEGLKAGDKLIIAGFEDLNNGSPLEIQ